MDLDKDILVDSKYGTRNSPVNDGQGNSMYVKGLDDTFQSVLKARGSKLQAVCRLSLLSGLRHAFKSAIFQSEVVLWNLAAIQHAYCQQGRVAVTTVNRTQSISAPVMLEQVGVKG